MTLEIMHTLNEESGASAASEAGTIDALKRPGDIVDHLCEELGNDIISGRLKAGQKLSEPALARRFGVSRVPVREAILRLEERRLAERRPNAGARVAEFSAQKIVDLFFLREALEGMAARLAAQHITREEIAAAHAILERQTAAWNREGQTGTGYLGANLEFHTLIRNASRNEIIADQLCDQWHFFSLPWIKRNPDSIMRGSAAIEDHYRILHALETRDGDLAEMLMRRHVGHNRQRYEKGLLAEKAQAQRR